MRIAILSDLHANLDALQAISDSWDQLWVLGDLVNYGPDPAGVVDFVRAHAVTVVRGNHDHAVGYSADPRCSPAFRAMARVMQAYTESILNQEQKAYLRQLPLTALREVDGKRFFLCHAAPSDPLFRYGPQEPAFWAQEAGAVNADILLVGHTHLPFILNAGPRQVVNPGSVGQPKHGRCEACYALWDDGKITLKSKAYDVGKTVARLLALPVDAGIRSQLIDVLTTASPSPSPSSEHAEPG